MADHIGSGEDDNTDHLKALISCHAPSARRLSLPGFRGAPMSGTVMGQRVCDARLRRCIGLKFKTQDADGNCYCTQNHERDCGKPGAKTGHKSCSGGWTQKLTNGCSLKQQACYGRQGTRLRRMPRHFRKQGTGHQPAMSEKPAAEAIRQLASSSGTKISAPQIPMPIVPVRTKVEKR